MTGRVVRIIICFIFIINILFTLSKVYGAQKELNFESFSLEDGLPNNHIQRIFQDSKGWVWIGTSHGLSRFNGYNFVNYNANASDSSSLKGNLVRIIYEDSKGTLWIGTENGSLNAFDRNKEIFIQPFSDHPVFEIPEFSVNDITEDGIGNLYVATNTTILRINEKKEVELLSDFLMKTPVNFINKFVRKITFDDLGRLWVGTNEGLFLIDFEDKSLNPVTLNSNNDSAEDIWEIFNSPDGKMWIGTYFNGVIKIDPNTFDQTSVKLEPRRTRNETVRSISVDDFGNYWIGTRGGLYILDNKNNDIAYYSQNDGIPGGILNNSILDVYHGSSGETWIGSRGGLNLLSRNKQVFRNYGARSSDNRFLNSADIYAFWMNKDENLWVGTEDGGINIYNFNTGTYEYVTVNSLKPGPLSKNCIKSFAYDGKGKLYVGIFMGGIDVVDLNSGKIVNHSNNKTNTSLNDNRVTDLTIDNDNYIWITTWTGLNRFNPTTQTFEEKTEIISEHCNWVELDSKNNLWIGGNTQLVIYNLSTKKITRHNEYTRDFLEDSKGWYWLTTTNKGLAHYSITEGSIEYFDVDDGLLNNNTLCIEEDNQNNLWVSSLNGLARFTPKTGLFHTFTKKDGLKNNQYNYGASLKTKDGQMIFGGISGFDIFDPEQINFQVNDAPLVFTNFSVLNKTINVTDNESSILQKSISETNRIELNHKQKVFTLEFAALNYSNNASIHYSYFLEGFDQEWSKPGPSRKATYTNLNPGDYTLHVKPVFPGQSEADKTLKMQISILPPFWKADWFIALIFVFIAAILFTIFKFIVYREKIKNELAMERVKAHKMHELDSLKLKFFTNISHEIRTPLTLIMAPLEKLRHKKLSADEFDSHVEIMYRNTKNLNKLINQLLDFRKLESGKLKLELSQGDIVRFVGGIIKSFEDYALEKGINLKFNTLKKNLITRFDEDKIEKILNNLLSNAFKFTHKGGKITVNLALVFNQEEDNLDIHETEQKWIEISVRDTGQGIENNAIPKIFNRFFQGNTRAEQTGTGVGLAFVKELVKLHKGKIRVYSQPGKGSRFTITIPYLKEIQVNEIVDSHASLQENTNTTTISEKEIPAQSGNTTSQLMLVVEDNSDVRKLISRHFQDCFEVMEADNGNTGWKKALEVIPDVIISDVLMPDMDGYELCKRIKKDERTSHIPVLLLTALHSRENKIKGLSYGADDYITKPFDLGILQSKIDNMMAVRKAFKEKYSGEIRLEPKNITITSNDEKFLNKVITVVEEHIDNADLDIELFAREVGVSRMQLYRKLNALTDMTVKEFIRNIRLKRAAQLLLQDSLTVSEVAYNVGFRDLSHFRKCFRQMYGSNATDYVKNHKSEKAI